MYLRYENGCVYASSTGEADTFVPIFFCDELSWQRFLFDSFSLRDYSGVFYEPDYDDFYEPFDYDFDI